MDRHYELILLQTVPGPLSVGPAQIIIISLKKRHARYMRKLVRIIRLTHLETLKAFQLKFISLSFLNRDEFLQIQDLKENVEVRLDHYLNIYFCEGL